MIDDRKEEGQTSGGGPIRRRRHAGEIYRAALAGADPEGLVRAALSREGPAGRWMASRSRPRRVRVVALGKAAAAMVRGVRDLLSPAVPPLLVIPEGDAPALETGLNAGFEVMVGEHPLPGPGSFAAGKRVLEVAADGVAGDLLVVLLSGGGSALAEVPAPGLTSQELRQAHALLLRRPWSITRLNRVRAHLSGIKGGRLAAAAAPADVLTLALLDVPRNAPWACASGPTLTVPVPARDEIPAGLSKRARAILDAARCHEVRLPPHPFVVVGDERSALRAAAIRAGELGYRVVVRRRRVAENAERFGRRLAREAVRVAATARRAVCILRAGEPAVEIGPVAGTGGRCQHSLLAALPGIDAVPGVTLLAGATDGVDGTGGAAGACIDAASAARGRALHLDARKMLVARDSGGFHQATGDQLRTGPSGTNVGDLFVSLIEPSG